jgi:hypothetical protein
MKNLLTYEQFLLESTPTYSFDKGSLKVGDFITTIDGFSGFIISKEISNGKVQYRDNKGVIHICELSEITKVQVEEDVTTDPNRTVGTGTYTSTHSDQNVTTRGYSNTTDPASGGSYPVYIS